MNVLAIVRQQRIRDTVYPFILTLDRFNLFGSSLNTYHYSRLINYWSKELRATDEDIHKADGPIRTSKQTR